MVVKGLLGLLTAPKVRFVLIVPLLQLNVGVEPSVALRVIPSGPRLGWIVASVAIPNVLVIVRLDLKVMTDVNVLSRRFSSSRLRLDMSSVESVLEPCQPE